MDESFQIIDLNNDDNVKKLIMDLFSMDSIIDEMLNELSNRNVQILQSYNLTLENHMNGFYIYNQPI